MPISQINTNSIANGAVVAADIASGQTLSLNGVTFPATQVPSGDANTLDDYEEGTFTPQIWVVSTQQTLCRADGAYKKIGQLVMVQIAVILSGSISGSGSVELRNLPFTAGSYGPSSQARGVFPIGYTNASIMPAGIVSESNTTIASIFTNSSAGSAGVMASQLQGSSVTSNWNFHASGCYRTAS